MHFKPLLVSFLLPPFGFVTLAVFGLLLMTAARRAGTAIVVVAIIALIAFATPAVSDSLLVALETGFDTTPPAKDPPQAIVILGAEIVRGGGVTPAPYVGALTLERLRTGAELARRTGLPVLVTGGVVQKDQPPVGLLMAESMANDFRLPVRWTESVSADTWENASFSNDILRKAGIHSVYVVTQPWHMRRALQAFAHTGLTVTPAPTPFDSDASPSFSDFLPRASVWQAGYFAMHEWVGRVWYNLR